MCGIAGFTGQSNTSLLKSMTEVLSYRGPDDSGYFENNDINLGHRRLSIIDLATGDQPMSDTAKNIQVIFNGEIYNFKEIKEEYLKNYNFKTSSDTEVIVNLYLEKGEDFVSCLNGMFAIALWDERSKKLILARDRMGQKPLYYRIENEELFFASEPKSLILDNLSKNVDDESVSLYFKFGYVPNEKTIYQNIFKVLPGHYLTWQNNKFNTVKYWDLNFDQGKNVEESRFEDLLNNSVKSRLISDVPLGIFLSGGIDSSAIAYYASKNSDQKIKTFSIGFADKSFDESKYAKEVSEFLSTDHHHKVFTEKDLIDLMPKVFSKLDEPLADASILPTYLLSEFTREQVTVALGGDGGDELMAGYPTFQAHRYADKYSKLPEFMKSIIKFFVARLPVSHSNFSLDFKLKHFLRGADKEGCARDIEWMSAFNDEEQALLFNDDFKNRTAKVNQTFDIKEDKVENQVLHFWQRGYMVDDILHKVDRASMYNSLEVRTPFLDYKFVEYINSLPYELKLKGFKTKYILKQNMSGKLPDGIINRKKKGFGIPLAKWLATDLKSFLTSTLSKENLAPIGIFNQDYIDELVNNHSRKKQDNRIKLWTLLVFVQWYNNYIK